MADTYSLSDEWASLVINQVVDAGGTVLGFIMVMNPNRPYPKWKLAGGHKEAGETPLQTAMRENQGETGLRLPPEAYKELTVGLDWRRRPTGHWSILFLAQVPITDVPLINEHDIGNEGEIVKYFTNEELDSEIRDHGVLSDHLFKLHLVAKLPV
jgi:ADP-ribose pyrophosphatase YjhB (NUDIX family)